MANCGPLPLLVFTVALIGGTFSTLLSKVMFSFETTDSQGIPCTYTRPLMQTFLMFLAMALALPIYYGYLFFTGTKFPRVKRSMWFVLAAPACTDMLGTMLMMIGLLYTTVSVYQLVRCLVIVYVALLRRFVLNRQTHAYQWFGVLLNAASVCIVSLAALNGSSNEGQVLKGIGFIGGGCFVMACQLVLEEAVMAGDDDDADEEGTPPLVVVGMEGFWGSLIMLCVVYPITYALPGDDHGSYENFYESSVELMNNPNLFRTAMLYVVVITTYNVSAIFITQLLESVWRSILENFRPIAVWGADLMLFYMVTHGAFGEAWLGAASYLQVFGLCMLLLGTATYNASIKWPFFKYPYAKNPHVATPGMEKIMHSPAINKSPGRTLPYRALATPPPAKGGLRTTENFPQAYGSFGAPGTSGAAGAAGASGKA